MREQICSEQDSGSSPLVVSLSFGLCREMLSRRGVARSPRGSFKNSAVNSGSLPAPWSMMSLLCDRRPA
jgi:hypothetical protein